MLCVDHLGRRTAGIGRRDDDDERVAVLDRRRGRCRGRPPRPPAPRDRARSRAPPRRARCASCRGTRIGGGASVVPNAASITTRLPGRCVADAASRPAGSRGARCGGRPCRCCGTPLGRQRQAGGGEDAAELGAPVVAQLRPARAEARRGRRVVDGVAFEDLGHVGPEQVERGLQARRRLGGAVAETDDPVAGVLLVVARLLHRLAGDRRELGVARALEALPEQAQEGRDGDVAQHGHGEVAARQLDQRAVAEIALVAQEGELVLAVALAAVLGLELAGARQHRTRLADQVERHVGEGDVFLDASARGRTTRPAAGRGSGRCRRCAAGTAPKDAARR